MVFMRLLFLALGLFSAHFCGAQIVEMPHFSQVLSYAEPDTLLILDIDDTLLIPTQMLGCDEWFQYRWNEYVRQGLNSKQALEKALSEWEGVRHLTQMEIVEPDSEAIIRDLQEQGHQVIGLTTQGLALATRTYLQLLEKQIDLSLTAPCQEDCYLQAQEHGVLYRKGILFTSGTAKGEALFRFCEKIGFQPKKIVFVNDKASHLADIEGAAEKRGVAFIGLRYSYSDSRKKAFVPEIADYQFRHSSFDRILSDQEAFEDLSRLGFGTQSGSSDS